MTTTPEASLRTVVLQMVRAEIDLHAFQRWMGTKHLQDPDHAMHCLLVECFGEFAPKPFRLIAQRASSSGVLYGYSLAVIDSLREAASLYADPLQSRVMPSDKMDSKPMPTQWEVGKRLGFETRIRPIVRRSRNTPSKPARECDAFQAEAEQYPKGGMNRKREEVYTDWLSGQFDRIGGASLDLQRIRLVSFQRTRAVRKLHGQQSEGPDAVMRGNLTVADSDSFAALLARGIGRHRAYGYGMLLLRPASA